MLKYFEILKQKPFLSRSLSLFFEIFLIPKTTRIGFCDSTPRDMFTGGGGWDLLWGFATSSRGGGELCGSTMVDLVRPRPTSVVGHVKKCSTRETWRNIQEKAVTHTRDFVIIRPPNSCLRRQGKKKAKKLSKKYP